WEWTRARRADTVTVEGKVRVRVASADGFDAFKSGLATYATTVEFAGTTVACVFDSVSWATDMGEVEQVYDGESLRLWRPSFRPRVIATRGGDGTFEVRAGDPSRALRVTVRDVAGNQAEHVLWLAPPRGNATGPDTSGAVRHARAGF